MLGRAARRVQRLDQVAQGLLELRGDRVAHDPAVRAERGLAGQEHQRAAGGDTACENPDGCGSDGGFTRSSAICSPPVQPPAGRHRACLVPGSALPDQLQPRPRPVGARPSAAACCPPPTGRASGARASVALLGRGVQGPVRVVQVGAAERAQVGPAGQDQRVHVVVGRDHADRDGRRCPAWLRIASANGVWYDRPNAGCLIRRRPARWTRRWRPRPAAANARAISHRVVAGDPALVPVGGRDPHGHRLAAGQTARIAAKTSSG